MGQSVAQQPLERVRGMVDQLPENAHRMQGMRDALAETFTLWGFRPVHVPVVEFSELFLRKSGADIASKMYAFSDHSGRRICLRPEFTASVVRLYVHHAHKIGIPARFWYSGPAFRYEKPQRGRYRQFTQTGVEILGAPPGLADAELIALACAGLDHLGIANYRVVIGHIGVVLSMLSALALSPRMQSALLQGLEGLKKSAASAASTRQWLSSIVEMEFDGDEDPSGDEAAMHALIQKVGRSEAVKLMRALLGTTKAEIGGGRDPDEIVERLLDRVTRSGDRERLDRAVAFVAELAQLAGPRDQALADTAQLLGAYAVPHEALDEFRRVCSCLDRFGVDWSRVTVDLSLSRGLQYYTGPVFEIYAHTLGAESQLCGGGRYDGLVRALGARDDVPALGFSYGLERLALVSEMTQRGHPAATALVVPIDQESEQAAHRVASALRAAGKIAELDVRGRGRRGALEHASRAGILTAVFIDAERARRGVALVRSLDTGEEWETALDQIELQAPVLAQSNLGHVDAQTLDSTAQREAKGTAR